MQRRWLLLGVLGMLAGLLAWRGLRRGLAQAAGKGVLPLGPAGARAVPHGVTARARALPREHTAQVQHDEGEKARRRRRKKKENEKEKEKEKEKKNLYL